MEFYRVDGGPCIGKVLGFKPSKMPVMSELPDTKQPSGRSQKPKKRIRRGIPFRKNVLILVGIGYLAVLIIFCSMAIGDMTAETAYEVVKGPLMALIGGSLALSKDLVDNVPGSQNEGTSRET